MSILDCLTIKTKFNSTKVSSADLIKARYQTCMSFLHEYVEYLQKVENWTKVKADDAVSSIAAEMVERFNLGNRFMEEAEKMVIDAYRYPILDVIDRVIEGCEVEHNIIGNVVNDLNDFNISDKFSARFRSIFK